MQRTLQPMITAQTQCHNAKIMPVRILPAGTGTPGLGEGDAAGSYFTIARTSAGNYKLSTKDASLAVVSAMAEASLGFKAKLGLPTHNADNTWSWPLYTASDASTVASVGSITGGTGYSNSFAVTFTGGGGTGALGVATASGGVIQSVAITNPGYGYTSAPTPVFTAGGGSTGSATAVLATGAAADMVQTAGFAEFVQVFLWLRDSTVTP